MSKPENVPLNIVCFCGVEFMVGLACTVNSPHGYYYKTEKFSIICPSCKFNFDIAKDWNPSE